MAEVKHTPGPWNVTMHGSFETEVRSESGRRVAATWVQGPAKSREGALNQGRVNEANARLIAAAPELLEAAKAVLAGLNARIDAADRSNVPVFYGIVDLHDAIAKAEGRT